MQWYPQSIQAMTGQEESLATHIIAYSNIHLKDVVQGNWCVVTTRITIL